MEYKNSDDLRTAMIDYNLLEVVGILGGCPQAVVK